MTDSPITPIEAVAPIDAVTSCLDTVFDLAERATGGGPDNPGPVAVFALGVASVLLQFALQRDSTAYTIEGHSAADVVNLSLEHAGVRWRLVPTQ